MSETPPTAHVEKMKSRAPTTAIFTVRLSDGTFDSSLSVPITAEASSYEAVIAAWLNLMHEALRHAPTEEPKP